MLRGCRLAHRTHTPVGSICSVPVYDPDPGSARAPSHHIFFRQCGHSCKTLDDSTPSTRHHSSYCRATRCGSSRRCLWLCGDASPHRWLQCIHVHTRPEGEREGEGFVTAAFIGRSVPRPDWTCDHEHDGVNTGGHDQAHCAAINQQYQQYQQSAIRCRRNAESRIIIAIAQYQDVCTSSRRGLAPPPA